MGDAQLAYEVPAANAVAWLDISLDNPDNWTGRRRTGPLGLQIGPLRGSRAPHLFRGARLRGARCVWTASTVSGAELHRPARASGGHAFDQGVHLLARIDAPGSVFDPAGPGSATGSATTVTNPVIISTPATGTDDLTNGTLQVCDPSGEIAEQFTANAHLFTLNIPLAAIGVEAATIREMSDRAYDLTAFQAQLLRSAVGLLSTGGEELVTSSSLIGVDRYLSALAGLLLRTAVRRPNQDIAQAEQTRMRTDAIIFEQASDPSLTPATIAAQLNISLRQLYRAFTGSESPAARIRRRRLERAAEILATRTGPGQVERVAVECGFASAEYFSRAFRREFGLSPRAYRSAHRDGGRAGQLEGGVRGFARDVRDIGRGHR